MALDIHRFFLPFALGSIPNPLGNRRNLVRLSTFSNKLTGSIPDSIGQLAKLEELELGVNELSGGSLPPPPLPSPPSYR